METETLVTINIVLQERLALFKQRNVYLESLVAELVAKNMELQGLVFAANDVIEDVLETAVIPENQQ